MRRYFPCTFTSVALLAATLPLAGCTTIYSQIHGDFDMPGVELNDYPVQIIAVDGAFQTQNEARVEPGIHSLVVSSKKPSVFRVRKQQAIAFPVEPCTHYYLAARHATNLSEDWTLVVRKREPVGGCDAEAARKAALN